MCARCGRASRGTVHLARVRDGVEAHANRAVADGVHVHLEAHLVETGHEPVQPVRLEVGQSAIAGPFRPEIRGEQRGRLRLDHAVEEELRGVRVQVRAAVLHASGHQALNLLHVLRRIDVLGGPHADGQAVLAVGVEVGVEHLRARLRLLDGDDAQLGEAAQRVVEPRAVVGGRRRGHEALDQPGRRLAQGARRLAGARVALDAAARRVGRLPRDARERERLRVDPRRVPVGRRQVDGPRRLDGVEQRLRRVGVWKHRQIPAAAHDPRPCGVGGDARLDGRKDRGPRGGGGEVALPRLHPGADRVHVRIVEPGQHEASARVHDAGGRPDVRLDVAVGPDRDEAAAADGERLGPRARRVHGVDARVAHDQIGRRGRGRRRLAAAGARREPTRRRESRAQPPPRCSDLHRISSSASSSIMGAPLHGPQRFYPPRPLRPAGLLPREGPRYRVIRAGRPGPSR